MQQQQHNDGPDMRGAVNGAYAMTKSHALTWRVITSCHFGREGIGAHGLLGLLMMLVYGGLMQSYAMFIYLCLYLLMCLGHRIRQIQNWQKGVFNVHSRYSGYPWLAFKLFPRLKSERDGRAVEAFLSLGVGWLLMAYVDQALGFWVMGAFISILLSEGMEVESRKRRLQAMRDAEIENEDLMREYREGRF